MFEDFYLGNKNCWEASEPDPYLVREISAGIGLPPLLAKVLAKRGYLGMDGIKTFLKPSVKNLHDPMLLPDMDKAVERILCAISKKERVIVYGDYDVDGITATSIMVGFLQFVGMDVSFYIPDRMDEGYGISEAAVDYFEKNAFDLMITVDCGISARDRLEQICERLALQSRTMDFIITDHHQPNPDSLPKAVAIVNPYLATSQYPFSKLCGAGIAFKLVQALCGTLNLGDKYLDYVDLAAMGTVADIVSLTDENRILVWAGLKKIQRRPNLGIQALIHVAELKEKEIDSWKLAFLLAPRINAAGRMGDASRGVRLFTTQAIAEANHLAIALQQDNLRRQKTQEEIIKKAIEAIDHDPSYQNDKVIVTYGEDWHHGVIGIVASTLVERYKKPCFVLSVSDTTATGSARSVSGFNVFHAMEACKELFIKYGGHEQAGGLTIRSSDVTLFRKMMNSYAESSGFDDTVKPKLEIDAVTHLEELNMANTEAIMALAPFGEDNPSPIFRLNQVTVLQKKRIGSTGSHLRLVLGTKENGIAAIAFRMGELEPYLPISGKIDVVFSLDINEFMGKKSVQLNIKAIRITEESLSKNRILLEAAEKVESLDYNEEWIYNEIHNQQVKYEDIRLLRDELGVLYRYLIKAGNRTLNRADLFRLADEISQSAVRMNYFKLLSGMFIFDELDIIRFSYTEQGDYKLQVSEIVEKASLEDSTLYNFLQTVQQVVEK